MKNESVMKVGNLCVNLRTDKEEAKVVKNVNFNLYKGKVQGLIGESGCGKSVTCLSLMGLLDRQKWKVKGDISLKEEKLNYGHKEQIRCLRGNKVSMIMQNPIGSFNPLVTVGQHFIETIRTHKSVTKKEAKQIASRMLLKVHLSDTEKIMSQYPFQLSGGMLQRVMIAISLFMCPEVIIADEPTTSLDVTIQRQILGELSNLRDNYKTAMLIVSHDLGVIAQMADEVAVMYGGYIVEKASVNEIFNNPLHPYTIALMKSKPSFTKERLNVIEGYPPSIMSLNLGCPFAQRCINAKKQCYEYDMFNYSISSNHQIRCLLYASEKGMDLCALS